MATHQSMPMSTCEWRTCSRQIHSNHLREARTPSLHITKWALYPSSYHDDNATWPGGTKTDAGQFDCPSLNQLGGHCIITSCRKSPLFPFY